ncbi:MAG: UDP-N-acetylmuramoyl-tripeptide--D-alanyl-D-alanine ligase [Paracoccaceae bacterium]
MTALWTSREAAAATGGECRGTWSATGVSIDTRTLQPGDLFVALSDRRDGHDFVARAFAAGAAAAMVSRLPDGAAAGAPLLVVADVLDALWRLARAARARSAARVIAVTGSVGKTGTKEMLRTALSRQGAVHAAERSFNNRWGVPLTLARMPGSTDYCVVEIGMNAPGETAPLAMLARPHAAIVTTVDAVHTAAFPDVAAIAREKAAIFEGLEPPGTAILNRDDATYPVLLRKARRCGARPVRFGSSGRPEFRLRRAFLSGNCTTIRASVGDAPLIFKLAAPGRHLAMNALSALAGVQALGADVGLAAVALGSWKAPPGRGSRWRIGLGDGDIDGGVLLIDESYNANPRSMAAALEVLAAAEPENSVGRVAKGRRIAFLGDMLELGPGAEALHAAIAALPQIAAIDVIHTAGPLMKSLHGALPPERRGEWHATSVDLAGRARRLIDAGDVVMVKGSLGSRTGLIVDAIKNLGNARAQDAA